MVVWTLALAALGFALLVAALITGSVVWAWACIAACVVGAVLLLVGVLRKDAERGAPAGTSKRIRLSGRDRMTSHRR